jgi:plasmid stabilization system protein ParE
MKPPIFTELADADLIDIYTYSYEQWGEYQAERFGIIITHTVEK